MFQNFEFKNFKASGEVKIYGNIMLCQTADYVPDRFSSLAKMTIKNGEYVCHLEIFSNSGLFIEEVAAADPKEAIDLVDKKMREHVLNWRTKHFIFSSPTFWQFKKIKSPHPHSRSAS